MLAREVYDDWVPKKLEIDLKLQEEPVDFERFRAAGLQVGEHELPSGAEEYEEPNLPADVVNMLVQMGIPELSAKHAVFNTQVMASGSSEQDAEIAMSWFYENIDNPVLQTPLPKVKKAK